VKNRFIVSALILLTAILSHAQVELMPVADILPGMRGVVLTTFENTDVVEVAAEVRGVLRNALGPKGDIIVVALSGEQIEYQGVANGMSGSPFYIDGKLVGALAYRLSDFPKEPIAGVTPIQDMIDAQYGSRGAPQVQVDYSSILGSSSGYQKIATMLGQGPVIPTASRKSLPASISPIMTNLSHSGISSESLAPFLPIFQQMGFSGGATGNMSQSDKIIAGKLKPGMPLSVMMMDGDYTFGSSGTVTHIEGNKVWAFGHPLYQMGSVNLPFARAEMLTVLSSLQGSSHMVSNGQKVGVITEDRATCVFGELGAEADMLPISVVMKHGGILVNSYNFSSLGNNNLTPSMLAVAANYSILQTQKISGDLSGTISVNFKLENLDDLLVTDFYSGPLAINDFSYLAASLYHFIINNQFKEIRAEEVNITIDLEDRLKVATLERAWLTKNRVKPGERFYLMMDVKPQRGRKITFKEVFAMPESLQPGDYSITIGNGATIMRKENEMVQGQIKTENFEQILRMLNMMRRNNRLYAQTHRAETGYYYRGNFFPNLPPGKLSVMGDSSSGEEVVVITKAILDERKIDTNYIINGSQTVTFTVEKQ
jgi:hypothetical protein